MNLPDGYMAKLADAERAARCVIGWAGLHGRGPAIRVHAWGYDTPTGNSRACAVCGLRREYGPRLHDAALTFMREVDPW